MTATVLDGNRIASEIRAEVTAEVKALVSSGMRPGLAVVLVGNNPASEIYVRGKVKSSEEVGLYSEKHTPPADVTTTELLALVEDLNRRDEIDGILVQLPLPPQVDSTTAGPGALHAGRGDGDAAPVEHPHRRPGRGSRGA